MIEEQIAVAVDFGGTRTRFAAVRPDGTLFARHEQQTRPVGEPWPPAGGPEAAIQRIADGVAAVKTALNGQAIGLGVAAPGPTDPRSGTVFLGHNLHWDEVRLADELEHSTRLRTLVDNDANLAALGEARRGAARGAHNLVYITISTGVGAGVIADGQLLTGEYGTAGEVGHTTIWPNGRACACGNRGCLETYASGTAIAERAWEAIADGATSSLASIGATLRAEDVAEAAEHGDELAVRIVNEAGFAIGIAVRNVLHLFDPEVVVLGGGVMQMGRLIWDPLLAEVKSDRYASYAEHARVVPAQLGDDQGLIGAGLWVHDRLGSPYGR